MTTQILVAVKWTPPPIDTFKLNTNEATKSTKEIGGIGGVVRDNKGNWIMGFTGKIKQTNPAIVELQALRTVSKWPLKTTFVPVKLTWTPLR